MKKMFYLALVLLILYSVYLCSVSVINGEVNLFNDVARDFLLLQELDAKKIVLIGPRTNTSGLFHGPLWTYINYPAYLVGAGNPVVVAWFWILLVIIFLATSFIISKKLFGTLAAFSFILLLSTRLVPHVNGIFHSEATLFVMPIFFFTMVKYLSTKKTKWLTFNLISASALIQLNIGDGIPFLILSTLASLWFIYKNRYWKHLLSFLIIPLCLINYILFDVRHGFQMIKALFMTGTGSKFFITFPSWIQNRIENTVSLQLIDRVDLGKAILIVIFLLVILFTFLRLKNEKKQLTPYFLLVFYYFGYIVLSYFNKGVLLYHYTYLLIPLGYLWIVSFLNSKYKSIFILIVVIVYLINLSSALDYVDYLKNGFMGKNPNSWKGLSQVAQKVVDEQKQNEFGYFVFSPDSFAYQPRYAMLYSFKKSHAKAREYEKKATTYVIAQPPPADDKYMDYKWWVRVPVGINAKPISIKTFPNGYKILKYQLTKAEQKIPHDKAIELGIHFR